MSKYADLKFLKPTEARKEHQCNLCGNIIQKGEIYYSEEIQDKFLHSLHRKKFCKNCYEKIDK